MSFSFQFKFTLIIASDGSLLVNLQSEFQVCLRYIVGMNEMEEFKFRPKIKLLSSNLKFTDSLSIDVGVGVYVTICTSLRPKSP